MGGPLDISKASSVARRKWKIARRDYAWSFPRDHWAHRGYHMEWWYFTGHLETVDKPPRRFGYQFTIFRIGYLPEQEGLVSKWAATDLLMAHAAVTNVSKREHRFVDLIYPEIPMLVEFHDPPEKAIAQCLAPRGTIGFWVLRWNSVGFDFEMKDDERAMAFRLTTRPLKPLVLQGPNGYIRKGKAQTAASQYYSFTRLSTRGTLTLDDHTLKVRGTSWMDKEFGSSQLSKEQVGWDWFCLQLHGGRELMLYLLRRKDGTADYRNGTLVTAGGTPRYLEAGEWSVQATDTWTSPATKTMYPIRWFVELPIEGLCLDIVPEFPDQENCSRIKQSPSYWEGAVRILDPVGNPVGRGYVELIGYGENSRPSM
jgi:predicted secreted hydrolase